MTAEVRRWKTMKARMHHRNNSNTTLDSDTTWAITVCSTVTKGRQATSATEATITTEYSFPKLSRSPSVPTATTARTNARSMRASMTRREPDSVVSMEDTATVDAYTEDTMQENTKTTAKSFQNDFGSDRREWSREWRRPLEGRTMPRCRPPKAVRRPCLAKLGSPGTGAQAGPSTMKKEAPTTNWE